MSESIVIEKTIAVHPSTRDIVSCVSKKILQIETKNVGFVIRVNKLTFKGRRISFIGNYIFDIVANVDVFVPREGMIVDAVVDVHKGTAHLAMVDGRMSVIFHSEQVIDKDTIVKLQLKNVRFQCATFRAVGELV